MKSQPEVAQALDSERRRQKLKYVDLAKATGLSVLAVRQALQGKTALRITSLMALADRLGLELMLQPKVAATNTTMAGDGAYANLTDPADPAGQVGGAATAPGLTSV